MDDFLKKEEQEPPIFPFNEEFFKYSKEKQLSTIWKDYEREWLAYNAK